MCKVLASACLFGLVVTLAGCSGDDSGPTAAPTPAATPTPSSGCTQTTLATATRSLTWNILDTTPFTTTEAGRVDITVDWQNAENNVGAFVVEAGTCSPQRFNRPGACTFLLESGGDKPHEMSLNLPPGSYELLLNDFGGSRSISETATVQIVLSTGPSCPAS